MKVTLSFVFVNKKLQILKKFTANFSTTEMHKKNATKLQKHKKKEAPQPGASWHDME